MRRGCSWPKESPGDTSGPFYRLPSDIERLSGTEVPERGSISARYSWRWSDCTIMSGYLQGIALDTAFSVPAASGLYIKGEDARA